MQTVILILILEDMCWINQLQSYYQEELTMSNEKKLREAPVGRLIASMSLPMILIMIVQVIYNLADTFFLGRYGSALQVAAVSLAAPVFSLFSAVNTLAGFGGCTAASMALGRGDKKQVRQISAFVLYFSLAAGVLICGSSLIFIDPLVRVLGADQETIGFAREYLRWAAVNAPFAIAGGALGNTLRADGDGKSLVAAALSGTVLNIVLDPLFIAVFGWGVTGAGIATLAGNVLSCVVLIPVIRKKEAFSVSFKDFTLKKEVSVSVLGLGIPMAASTFLMSFSSLFSNRLFVSYGNTALAANGVAGKAGMLIGMLLLGISMGIQPAISYNHSAGRHTRVRKIVLSTAAVNIAVALVLSLLIFFGRHAFISAFLKEETAVLLGEKMILGTLIASPFAGIYQLCSAYLQAAGKVGRATLTAFFQKFLVYVPVLFIMNLFFSLNGLIYAAAVTDVLSAAAALFLCMKNPHLSIKKRPSFV